MGMHIGRLHDLATTDRIAFEVLSEMAKHSPSEIKQQMVDNINWIKQADDNKMVVGSQAEYYMLIQKAERESLKRLTRQ